jgi:hypothetical protein
MRNSFKDRYVNPVLDGQTSPFKPTCFFRISSSSHEAFKALDQVSSQGVPVELAQFVVADLVGKDVIDGHQDLVGDDRACAGAV